MDRIVTLFVMAMALIGVVTALECAPCNNVQCTPPPPGCELGRRPCSCCEQCRVPRGGACGPFSAECESSLVCYTHDGVFVGRPPIHSQSSGMCVEYSDIAHTLDPSRIG